MSSIGYIQVHAYTSRAQSPRPGVAVMITQPDGTAIAMRITDRSGLIEPVSISVPDIAAGQTSDTGIVPFVNVNIYARKEDFQQFEGENLQVFPNTVTYQNLELIPLAEFPEEWTQGEIVTTPPQNL